MRRLAAVIEALADAAGGLAGALTLLLTGIVAAGVIARRVFNAPFLFVEELSGYLVLAIVFLGLAYTMKSGGHIRAEFLLDWVGPRARRALETAALIVALAWAVLVVGGTSRLVAEYYTQQIRSFAYLQILLWFPGSLMMLGAALLTLQCVAALLRLRRN